MSANKPQVSIVLHTNARHLQQVFSGMETLAKRGDIQLSYTRSDAPHHKGAMQLTINQKTVFVDCADSPQISQSDYQACDYYFKRTLRPSDHLSMGKLHPFGLYFEIYPSIRSKLTVKRFMAFSESGMANKFKTLVKSLDTDNKLSFMPREPQFDAAKAQGDTVMFFVRLWDPYKDKEFELSEREAEDRKNINTLRIECVRQLKARFGDKAIVGVMDDDYARDVAPDLVVSASDTSKQAYLEQVKKAGVCIASTGLHESLGAKFAEYVALGKPIVSETFNYVLPGNIQQEKNYLTYSTPEECVAQVARLLHAPGKMDAMSQANRHYYLQTLLPMQIATRLITTVTD